MRQNPNFNQYDSYTVWEEDTLLEWLMNNVKGSKTRVKAILSGHSVAQ